MEKVYVIPSDKISDLSEAAKILLKKITESENISWNKDLPIKIHPGAIGNTAYNRPEIYLGIIDYLKNNKVNPYYIETCMEASTSEGKINEFKEHGFNQIPVIIADGPKGNDDIKIPINNGKHLKYGLIGRKLAEAKQVLVVSHFKGHIMAGFGGAIKMLGIGFESGRGKTMVHGKHAEYIEGASLHNWDNNYLSVGKVFNERMAESACAAVHNKEVIYITFAVNIVENCDCDAKEMEPVYKDVGVFASTDPAAIDKAVFDILEKREGKKPFTGDEIFGYAEQIGLGSTMYKLVNLD